MSDETIPSLTDTPIEGQESSTAEDNKKPASKEDKTPESTEEDGTSESETSEKEEEEGKDDDGDGDTETEAADLTVEELKLILQQDKEIPEGVNEDRVELARTQLQLTAAKGETEAIRAQIQADPSKLLTEEQKAELEEINSTKGLEAYFQARQKMQEEAMNKALNDPKLTEESVRLQRGKELNAFLKEHEISFADFKSAVLESNKAKVSAGEMTFQQFMEATLQTHQKLNGKKVYKGQTPPKIKNVKNSGTSKAEKGNPMGDLAKALSEA